MLMGHWLEQIALRCFNVVRPAKRKSTVRSRRRRLNVPTVAEVLEDRVLLAAASFNPNTFVLTIEFTANGTSGEFVTISNSSGTLTVAGDVSGDTSLFQQAVQRIEVTDSGGSNNQSLSIIGSAFSLEGGLNSEDVETVTINADIGLVASNADISATTITVGNDATLVTEGDGTITLNASRNVLLDDGNLSVRDGDLTITANQSGTGTGGFDGVRIQSGSVVQSTGLGAGAGSIIITGTGGQTMTGNDGVRLTDTGSRISSVNGDIILTGTGNGVLNGNNGVYVNDGSVIESTGTDANAATITITGTGADGTTDNIGVLVENSGTRISSAIGNISITGNGGDGSGIFNHGVFISDGGVVESTGSGADAATIGITGIGGDGSQGNTGVTIRDMGTKVTSVDGNVTINGTGGNGSGDVNSGTVVRAAAMVESTGTGANAATITIMGTGGGGTLGNLGVTVGEANTIVTSVDGDIAIIGTGGNGSATNNGGILITGLVQSTGTATDAAQILINGTGGGGTADHRGVLIANADAKVTSVDGNINITGVGGTGSSSQNTGVQVTTGGVVESTGTDANAATITITGTGGDGTENNFGVFVQIADSKVTSVAGDINITGTGGNGSAETNHGVYLLSGGGVESTGTGADAATISMTGTGGNGTFDNNGVRIQGTGSNVTSREGDITLMGTGGDGSAGFNHGVVVSAEAVVQSTESGANAAKITITGTGGDSTLDNLGVLVEGTDSQVNAVDGDITITGNGGGGSTVSNQGVLVQNGGVVGSTGTGPDAATITITGTGGSGTDSNIGVQVKDTGSRVTAVDGRISIVGTGGSDGLAGNDFNVGVLIVDNGVIDSTGMGAVSVTGTGGAGEAFNYGVRLGSNGVIRSAGGGTTVVGSGKSGNGIADTTDNHGVRVANGTAIEDTANGAVSITGLDSAIITSSSPASTPQFAGATVTLNGTVAPGSDDPGELSINGNFTLSTDVTLQVDLDGSTAITEFDRVTVTGTVTLGGAALDVQRLMSFNPSIGDSFILIDNDGTDAVTGTFAQSLIGVDGVNYLVQYDGGDGNDVVLSVIAAPPVDLEVDNIGDEVDGDFSANQLTLREAVQLANLQTDTNMITFAQTLADSTITLGGTQLDITQNVTITGLGATQLTIDANNASRIFDVAMGTTASISGITFVNGNAIGSLAEGDGGAIRNFGTLTVTDSVLMNNTAQQDGGAIDSANTLTVSNTTIMNNTAGRDSGAIDSFGTTTILSSTISGNSAAVLGGAIYHDGTLTVTNSTLSGNSAGSEGGAIRNADGTVTVVNSTIALNRADSDGDSMGTGGGIATFDDNGTSTTLYNTLVVGNVTGATGSDTADDLAGKAAEAGSSNNIVSEDADNQLPDNNGNQVVADVSTVIDTTLQNNGGATQTHLIQLPGPAVNAGDNSRATNDGSTGGTALATDQRGASFPRIFDTTVDIGAVELQDTTLSDLSVTMTDGDAANVFGSLIVYTITVSNAGSNANGVTLTETLASNVQFNAASSTAGWTETAPGSGTFTFSVGNLAENAQTQVLFAVNVETMNSGTAQTTNTVSVTDDGANGMDITPGNNSASDSTNLVAPISTVVPSAFDASLINGTFTELHAGNFDAFSTAGPEADADDLFFWDPVSGVNRIVFGDGTFQTNSIPPSFINGGDFTKVISGDFDNVDGEDLFFWNPVTGRNRLVRLSGTTQMVSADFENDIVNPIAINGNDFTQFVAGNFDEGGAADIFFWNPVTGRNRMIHTMPATMGMTQSTFQTEVIPANQINGNDFQRIDVGQFVAGGPDELFFLNLSSGRNRTVSFSVDVPGSNSSFAGSQTNQIEGTQLNGNAFSRVAVGDYNNDGLDDVFAWDPLTGSNRVGLTNVDPSQLSEVFSSLVDPSQINGNDFSVLISRSAGEGQSIGDDELFFWNPVTGRNRQAQA